MTKKLKRRRRATPQGLKPGSFHDALSARPKSRPDTKPPRNDGRPSPTQLVRIEKAIYGGAFLARAEGKAVFVPLVLPGEQARVRVVEEKRGYATAEVEEIVEVAAERVAPKCAHFGACGGCNYQHADYAAQLKFKKAILRETLERGHVHAPEEMAVLAGEPWGYRNRIRVAFDAEGNVGYRGQRSHAVIAIAECPIAAPLLVRAALAGGEIARRQAPRLRLSETALFCDAEEKALLAQVAASGGEKSRFEEFAQEWAETVPELKGVEFASATERGQSSLAVARWGASSLPYRAAGFEYRVDQGAFFQVNRLLVDGLAETVTGKARGAAGPRGGLAWDLFAGVGLFARRLAEQFEQVIAVETATTAVAALDNNLAGTSATAVKATTIEFLRAGRNERPDLIVVDPPRTGLGAETTELLGRIGAPEVVYVSCDPATLARDLSALIGMGYAIEEITLADLFPQTFHLETVVKLRR